MGVGARHAGDGGPDQSTRRHGYGGGLMLLESLDHVAAAVGGSRGRAGSIDQANDVLWRGDRIPMIDGKNPPAGGHIPIVPRLRGRRSTRAMPDEGERP